MRKRIIVIDRDNSRREKLVQALISHDLMPVDFESGQEALNDLLFNSVQAVVVDYGSSLEPNNPLPAGRQLVKEITTIDAFVPLVLICDRCDRLDHETSSATDLVIRKPLTAQQALDGIQIVLKETLRERAQRKSGYIFAFR